ncbi:MAG: CBS domain-containing protein [Nitrospira sp.]|nr:CBS domain-containing protein [Nitrospira sp.]MBH0183583.1 CBS domain-containing protein [Nitrospira sp.]MBH0187075.1 CBS domain-containing protein [Nitrospira sp.]
MRLAEYFVNAHDPKVLTVRQVMEDQVFTVGPETKAITIAEMMTDRNFGSVPIVKQDSTLVGLVSEFDLLRAIEEGKDLHRVTAQEIMTKDVVTVTEDLLVKDLIHLLQSQHLIRAPVVRGTTLVGIASRRDAVFGYVKATSKYWWPGKGSE